MHMSDCSSDVCSSNLQCGEDVAPPRVAFELAGQPPRHHRHAVHADAARTDALVAGLDDHRHAARVQDAVEGVGDLVRHALLDLQAPRIDRSEEHTSALQSLMRISYAVFCFKKKKKQTN